MFLPWTLPLCLTKACVTIENIKEMFHYSNFETNAPTEPQMILASIMSKVVPFVV